MASAPIVMRRRGFEQEWERRWGDSGPVGDTPSWSPPERFSLAGATATFTSAP